MEKAKKIIKQSLPWLITIGILAYVFGTQDFNKIKTAFLKADIKLFIPFAIPLLIITYNLDCISQWLCLKWFCAPVRYRDILVARGVSFLLMLIHFWVGQGAMVYFFYRLSGKSLKRVSSAFLFTFFGDFYSFITLYTIGIFVLKDKPQVLMILIPLCSMAWIYWIFAFCYWNLGWNKKFLPSLSEWEIFSSFKEARFSHYLKIYLLRFPLFILVNVLFYLAMLSFHKNVPILVPFAQLMVRTPIVMLISGLPSIGGLGPTQLGWNFMFSGLITEEIGTVLSLFWNLSQLMVNSTIGLVCLIFGRRFLALAREAQKKQTAAS